MPARADALFAVMSIGADGLAAVTYFAHMPHAEPALMLLDFDVGPFAGSTLPALAARLVALSTTIRTRAPQLVALIPEAIVPHAARAGIRGVAIPASLLADPPGLALSAAAHVAAGRVKISALAQGKAATLPLGGALDFRVGDDPGGVDPLRQAVLLGCAMALDPEVSPAAPPFRAARLGPAAP